ncbi:MAG: shikimate dehydrogenase [Gemmatimonadetes bacterium]|nr:shikimate dehydrogenase [Gemmatimonadota bacterium]
MIGGATRLVVLLGDPVSHSLSPRIQNAAFEAAGVDGVYAAMCCSESDLAGLLRGIARGGGAGNVTVPHKQAAARLVDEPSETVLATGACNTFWLEGGRIHGENTDVAGFRGAVLALLGRSAAGLRVVLHGAGGAARGALVALASDGAEEVVVWNRTVGRAERLVTEVGSRAVRAARSASELEGSTFDLVVNATSLGLKDGDALPFDPVKLHDPGAILDLVYRPDETALVRRAREMGIAAADGGEMLVLQGADAFRLWWDRPAPVVAMREALERSRREASGVARK